ncbi:MAG: hypothetical protein KBS66_04005 [Eubacterium sp.]|nr:hypothetical protein [Candidatus Colimonas fimequi]
MLLLFVALLVGIVLFVLLVRSMGTNTKYRIKYGTKLEKFTEIIKCILLGETIIYIIIFIVVIVKTIFI